MNLLRCAPLFLLSLVFAACGGGGGGFDLGAAIDSSRALTHPGDDDDLFGMLSEAGSVRPSRRLYAGDTRFGSWRSTAAYNLHSPEPGRTLAEATLTIDIDDVYGDPTRLGSLRVRSIEMNDNLDAGDYSTGSFRSRLIPHAELFDGNRIEVDVTHLVQNAYDRGSQDMDFRFQFFLPNSGPDESDGIYFYVRNLRLRWE